MRTAALAFGLLGAMGALVAAVWLLVGFKPEHYTDDGMLLPGQQRSVVLPKLLHDQRWVAALAVASSASQLLGVVFAILAGS